MLDLTVGPEALNRPVPPSVVRITDPGEVDAVVALENAVWDSLLLAARAQEARARGFLLLSVDASPMSRPILEKHGFQSLAAFTPCKWSMDATSPSC